MATLNPVAVGLWVFGSSLGYAIDGSHGLAIGLAITSGISFVLSMFGK